jgi:hypothetical protein
VISNETDLDEDDLIRAKAKLEEVIDTIVFEQKFEKHFSDVSKDVRFIEKSLKKVMFCFLIKDGLILDFNLSTNSERKSQIRKRRNS